MVDLLKESSDWLQDRIKEFRPTTVTYIRGSDQIDDLTASVGETIFEIDNGFDAVERWESRDFLIFAEDLKFNAIEFLPEHGDTIREIQGNKTYVYQVMSPTGEPFFRFSDRWRKMLRIHTKQIDVEFVLLVTSEGALLVTSEGDAISIV